jgi:drug/metabolite transporter (DMT)-like permease
MSITSWYWSLALLPMSDVTALGFLAPVFVALLAPRVLGEPTPQGIFLAMPFSTLGVLFVAQPSWMFGARSQTSTLGVAIATANVRPLLPCPASHAGTASCA